MRVGNRAAIALYRDTLGFEVIKVENKYYADGEDAYDMRMYLEGAKRMTRRLRRKKKRKRKMHLP